MHRYLFMEISDGETICKKIYKTRDAGIRKIEKILNGSDNEVEDIIYRDKRHHLQEFICNQGLRFLLYRV